MRVLFTAWLLFACSASAYSQIDTPRLPNETYSQYILHPETKLANLSYNYSGKWDLDGDQKTDSLYFSGNGGAHAYFFLRVILRSDSKIRDFTFIQIDFPLIQNKKLLLEAGRNPALQFVPDDFNNDGITDLYLKP